MTPPPLIMFDLDGTLAESKQPLTDAMATLVATLLGTTRVGIISGGALSQFLKQVVARLPVEATLEHLYLLPTSGAALYTFENDHWKKIYEERLSEKDKDTIEAALSAVIKNTGHIDLSRPVWGERIEYRGSQVTLSALGQHAPLIEKKKWDPTRAKKAALQAALQSALPNFSVKIGGTTSIDITRKGIDKAYGVRKLCEQLGLRESDALYVGDELGKDGNDEAVFKTAIQTHAVTDPTDTMRFVRSLLVQK